MLRVTTFRITGNPPPDTAPGAAVAAFNEFAGAAGKVAGAGTARWFFGNGGVVIVGEPANYAAADAILADSGVQAAGAKVFALGFGIAEDLFLLEAGKVMSFIPQT